MMTLAEFKRRVYVGAMFDCVNHVRPQASGQRTVTKVQSNGIWYRAAGADHDTYTAFPKASDMRSGHPDAITFMVPGTIVPAFTYWIGARVALSAFVGEGGAR